MKPAAATSKTLYGTTVVNVGEKKYTLIPTLGAVRAIEARFGGLRGAVIAQRELAVDGVAYIIAAGADLKAEETQSLPQDVWEAGIATVAPQLDTFLVALLNPKGAPGAEQGKEGNGKTAEKAEAQ